MNKGPILSLFEHPLALGSFRNWTRLLLLSQGISPRYWWRVLSVSLITLLASPLRIYERLRYSHLVEQTEINPQPVFIIGHWRTGTTYLHHLLCQDQNFAYVSTFQSLAPELFLMGRRSLKPGLSRIATKFYPTRLIDNIPLVMDAPQEEEFAIANLSPYSFLHAYTLPNQAEEFFNKYVFFQGLTKTERFAWQDVYLNVLKKASIGSSGKPLILKNPANSARIRSLLEIFPQARFIHLVRNPYEVYRSTLQVFDTVLPKAQIQVFERQNIELLVRHVYVKLMRKFLEDRCLIPDGHLVEIRYEDLERAPVEQVEFIYTKLGLPNFQQAEYRFRDYLCANGEYKKNEYQIEEDDIRCVNQYWDFALKTWGYPRIEK